MRQLNLMLSLARWLYTTAAFRMPAYTSSAALALVLAMALLLPGCSSKSTAPSYPVMSEKAQMEASELNLIEHRNFWRWMREQEAFREEYSRWRNE